MPVVYIDSEQADLIEVAVLMLEGALKARTKRADPDAIISNSLTLQSNKLSSFRTMLFSPGPPPFSSMSDPLKRKALLAVSQLAKTHDPAEADRLWTLIRALATAGVEPDATTQG